MLAQQLHDAMLLYHSPFGNAAQYALVSQWLAQKIVIVVAPKRATDIVKRGVFLVEVLNQVFQVIPDFEKKNLEALSGNSDES